MWARSSSALGRLPASICPGIIVAQLRFSMRFKVVFQACRISGVSTSSTLIPFRQRKFRSTP
jgi:hypothetical protein